MPPDHNILDDIVAQTGFVTPDTCDTKNCVLSWLRIEPVGVQLGNYLTSVGGFLY